MQTVFNNMKRCSHLLIKEVIVMSEKIGNLSLKYFITRK